MEAISVEILSLTSSYMIAIVGSMTGLQRTKQSSREEWTRQSDGLYDRRSDWLRLVQTNAAHIRDMLNDGMKLT